MKLCDKCIQSKDESAFNRRSNGKCKLCGECKQCQRKYNARYRILKLGWGNKFPPFLPGMKYCSKCNEVKYLIEFSKNKSRRNGYSSTCKKCFKTILKIHYSNPQNILKKKISREKWQNSERGKKLRKKASQKRKQRPDVREWNRKYMKEYHQRPEVKEKDREYKQRPETKLKIKKYWQRPEVKARRSEQRKQKYRQNPNEFKEKQKQRRLRNLECYRAMDKRYRERPEVRAKIKEYRQRPEIKQKHAIWMKQRRTENPEFYRQYKREYRQKPEIQMKTKEYKGRPNVRRKHNEYSKRKLYELNKTPDGKLYIRMGHWFYYNKLRRSFLPNQIKDLIKMYLLGKAIERDEQWAIDYVRGWIGGDHHERKNNKRITSYRCRCLATKPPIHTGSPRPV